MKISLRIEAALETIVVAERGVKSHAIKVWGQGLREGLVALTD